MSAKTLLDNHKANAYDDTYADQLYDAPVDDQSPSKGRRVDKAANALDGINFNAKTRSQSSSSNQKL